MLCFKKNLNNNIESAFCFDFSLLEYKIYKTKLDIFEPFDFVVFNCAN